MGLHVFHDPVLIKLARGVSSNVNLRFQKKLEKITQAFTAQTARNTGSSLPAHRRPAPRIIAVTVHWLGMANSQHGNQARRAQASAHYAETQLNWWDKLTLERDEFKFGQILCPWG
jgi:hypothetical protein